MRRSPGGRGPRGPPHGGSHGRHSHHHPQQHHAPYDSYAPGGPPLPPGAPSQGYLPPQHLHQQVQQFPPPSSSAATARNQTAAAPATERDVIAFVNAMRSSRSDPKAPPNALNMRDLLHAICTQFHVTTYEELFGSAPHQLPVLRQIQIQHERVWSFVTCYMHARRINTLHECHLAFLQQEAIHHFSELGIGNSFLHTDAVQTLYHAPVSIYPLTTKDVLTTFRHFETVMGHDAFAPSGNNYQQQQQQRMPQRIDRDQFKQFISQQRRQPSAEAMGLHIDADGFGPYIAMLRRISKKEQREIHELQEEFNKGIADRVFELSKQKFSAENRQQALDELLQRTNDERALELAPAGGGGIGGGSKRMTAKKATATLSSLSLEILNRVTDVDVYLDNMLRWKSADERFKARLGAHQIADTDQKIRTQLTQFLLASQKSRHHARVKVVTWVLCGILAKIHTLLQLDDKLPDEPTAAAKDKMKKQEQEEEVELEEEECDCCCVGEESCRCRCDCECHRDASDDDEAVASSKPMQIEEAVVPSQGDELTAGDGGQHQLSSSPAKRKRSRSRSDSVVVAVASPEEVRAAIQVFFVGSPQETESLVATGDLCPLLARVDAHLRRTFGTARLGEFSLVQEIAQAMEAAGDAGRGGSSHDTHGFDQLVACIRASKDHAQLPTKLSGVSETEVRGFIALCINAVKNESAMEPAAVPRTRMAVLRQACTQFDIDMTDQRTRRWLEETVERAFNDAMKKNDDDSSVGSRGGDAVVVHYAAALALPGKFRGSAVDDDHVVSELTLVEQSASAHGQVLATKTAQAQTELARCPLLVDVSEWTQWRTRFAPFCGPLRLFLQTHEMIRGDSRLHEDHVGSTTTGGSYEFVCCTNNRILKIHSDDETSASALDVAAISPEELAAVLVSLVVQHKGDDFPRALVLLHLRSIVKKASRGDEAEREHHDHDQSNDPGRVRGQRVARFVLETMLCVPHDFAASVFGLFQEALQPVALDAAVLACGLSRSEKRQLQLLGVAIANVLWAQATTDSRTRKTTKTKTKQAAAAAPGPAKTAVGAMVTSSPSTKKQTIKPIDAAPRDGSRKAAAAVPTARAAVDTSACHSFITTLRRDQFGIGLEINDAATRGVIQVQHRRLERALKRLSDELYSEKTHFVLELLQNADDNVYPTGTTPSGEFVLTRESQIVFSNNEIGFSQANIQAICDVGASTKAHEHEHPQEKHSIGKKGIGFKSVFKVSDTPEVHSNGFHIRFHAKDKQDQHHGGGGLGYILPYWIDDKTQWKTTTGTTFVLPLNHHSASRQHEISASLLAFEPSVLLFLQQIRQLRLVNQATQQSLTYCKHERIVEQLIVEEHDGDQDQGTAVATTTTISVATLLSEQNTVDCDDKEAAVATQQNWLIVRRQVVVPEVFSSQRGRLTEIAIALPLESQDDEEDEQDDDERRLPLQQVVCYLPLRSYGFRFILQGDFEVPSSREAISNGSDWNQWLVSQFPALFPALVGHITTTTGGHDNKLSLRELLRLLPLESDVQAPFRSIISEINREIRQLPCFPTATPTEMATASELLDISGGGGGATDDDDMAFLLDTDTAALVRRALGKHVMEPVLARATPAMLKAQLRIEKLRGSHVLRLLSFLRPPNSSNSEVAHVTLVLRLLHLLAKLWRHDRHRALLVKELRHIKCFPIGAEGVWISLAEISGGVLFLPSLQAKYAKTKTTANTPTTEKAAPASAVTDDLVVLRNDFAMQLEEKFPETRRFLIDQLGVKELEDHDLMAHHILPSIAAMAAAAAAGEGVVSAQAELKWQERVAFLAGHLKNRCPLAMCPLASAIRKAMCAVTWSKRVVVVEAVNENSENVGVVVVLPAEMKRLEACCTWLRQRIVASKPAWDILALERFDGDHGSVEEDALRGLWIDTCALPRLFDASDRRMDKALGEIVTWIASEQDLVTKRRVSMELAQFMASTWPPQSTSAEETEQDKEKSWWWQQAAWLEGSDGDFYRPQDLWVQSPAVDALFGRSGAMVPIAKLPFESESLRAAWQLKTTPTVGDVLAVLRRLSESSCNGSGHDLEVAQAARLYSFLLDQCRVGDGEDTTATAAMIRQAFSQSPPLIFVPAEDGAEPTNPFLEVDSVVWSSGSSDAAVASSLTGAATLDQVYSKTLRAFFVGVCGVEKKPTVELLVQALASQLGGSAAAMTKKEWKRHVLPLLRVVAKHVVVGKGAAAQSRTLKKTLTRLAWIPVVGGSSSSVTPFQLTSAKKAAARVSFHGRDGNEREIQQLYSALASSRQEVAGTTKTPTIACVVALDDEDVLAEICPLLEFVGAVSIGQSLLREPSDWCRSLAELGSSAVSALLEPRRRRRTLKKYTKLLQCVLLVWAKALVAAGEAEEDTNPLRLLTELAHLTLFPSTTSCETYALHRGVDLFLNDQSILSQQHHQQQMAASSLPLLGVYDSGFFVHRDSSENESHHVASLYTLLGEIAQVKSLAQHLHTEVVVLGIQQDQDQAQDAATNLGVTLARVLRIAQRVVFHQHPRVHATLDHVKLQRLLPAIRIVEIVGDERALQLLHRVATTEFTLRESVACYLDKPSQQLFLVVDNTGNTNRLFDVLREICRQCFGETTATSVANVLFLASMQPTTQALESWLVDTQHVPPLDARCGTATWFNQDDEKKEQDSTAKPSQKRARRAKHSADDHEDGQVEEEEEEGEDDTLVAANAKRAKHDHVWDANNSVTPAYPGYTGVPVGGAPYNSAYPTPFDPANAYGPRRAGGTAPVPPPILSSMRPLHSLHHEPGSNTLTDQEKLAIGRWGEEYVYEQLKQSYAGRADVHVDWVNEKEESGLPYDILVKTGTSNDVEYVEVKATKTMEKGVFEISVNELDQAAMHGSRYSIYRVFNAGNPSLCRVVRMKNPIALVRQKKIQLVLLMQ